MLNRLILVSPQLAMEATYVVVARCCRQRLLCVWQAQRSLASRPAEGYTTILEATALQLECYPNNAGREVAARMFRSALVTLRHVKTPWWPWCRQFPNHPTRAASLRAVVAQHPPWRLTHCSHSPAPSRPRRC